jgi:hypothetical protein
MVVREIKLCTLSFLRVELVSTGVPLEVMLLLVLGGFAVAVEVCSCCPQRCCHARKVAVFVCCVQPSIFLGQFSFLDGKAFSSSFVVELRGFWWFLVSSDAFSFDAGVCL